MPIHIKCPKDFSTSTKLDAKIQSVPFYIHADCEANVNKYFEPYVKIEEDKSLTASFRGRPLNGTKIELPKGYVGVVLHESNMKYLNENQDRTFYAIHKFNNFIYWNLDKKPSQNDTLLSALDWLEIAEVLHKPIEEDEKISNDVGKGS